MMTACFAIIAAAGGIGHAKETTDHADAKFFLSDAAVKNYGVKTVKVAKNGFVTLPRSAFVASKDGYFAYGIDKDGRFEEIAPHQLQIGKEAFTFFNGGDLDEFVTAGAKYLRIIGLSQSASASGHSH